MVYILIQLLLNAAIFIVSPKQMTVVYKKIAYIIYPILISFLIVLPSDEIGLNENYGIALDITDLYSKSYLLTLSSIILVQFICNNFLFKIARRLLFHE